MKSIQSISEYHRLLSLPAPRHPLVSIINISEICILEDDIWKAFCVEFYCISLKRNVTAKVKYGQQYYDFDCGVMNFVAPKQIMALTILDIEEINSECGDGYMLLIHPDFFRKYSISKVIKSYGFFSYSINEALHLSDYEEESIIEIFQKIIIESQHIDRHTQGIILSNIDLLLNYCERFYERQFITRIFSNDDLIPKVEQILNDYFENEKTLIKGLPSVEYLASELNVSPHYLSDMLRTHTRQNAQQHIHEKLLEKAKEYLASSNLTVAEIAYRLGFEYPQSFNKLFKSKLNISPLKYRKAFN